MHCVLAEQKVRACAAQVFLIAAMLIVGPVAAMAQAPGRVAPASRQLLPSPGRSTLPAEDGGAIGRFNRNKIGGPDCTVRDSPDCPPSTKIINGDPAPDTQYGFIVAIYYDKADGSRHICTGTLLTPQLVLTAGHCGCGVRGSYTVDYRQDTQTGDANRYDNVDGLPILYDQRVCQDGYLGGGRDLALIRLRDKLKPELWKYQGYPSNLIWDLRQKLVPGRRLVAVGYGYTEVGLIGVRMQTTIPIVSADCTTWDLASVCAPFAEMILAEASGPRIGADTCGGDSGGPIFLIENNRPTLVAVTSRAAPGLHADSAHHCGGGGIYTLIGRRTVQEWLKANGVPEVQLTKNVSGLKSPTP